MESVKSCSDTLSQKCAQTVEFPGAADRESHCWSILDGFTMRWDALLAKREKLVIEARCETGMGEKAKTLFACFVEFGKLPGKASKF